MARLSVVSYLLIDGQTIPVEELTDEQRARWKATATRRLSEALSDYYTMHPEEFELLPGIN